jgi:hypothetical protein
MTTDQFRRNAPRRHHCMTIFGPLRVPCSSCTLSHNLPAIIL